MVWNAVADHCAAALIYGNPYVAGITNRNLFQLKSLEPVIVTGVFQPPPLREVKLSGVTGIYGKKVAILRVPQNAKGSEPREVSLVLGEGAFAEEGVRVLEIDLARGMVRIMNSGTEQLLDIAKNSPKAGVTANGPTGEVPRMDKPSVGAPSIAVPTTSLEEQMIMMEVNRLRDRDAVSRGELPPYPRTELSETIEQELQPQK